jgi:hypothetical protein
VIFCTFGENPQKDHSAKQVGRGLEVYRQIKGQDSGSLIGIQTWYTSLLETRHSGISCPFAAFNGSGSVCVIELSAVWDYSDYLRTENEQSSASAAKYSI